VRVILGALDTAESRTEDAGSGAVPAVDDVVTSEKIPDDPVGAALVKGAPQDKDVAATDVEQVDGHQVAPQGVRPAEEAAKVDLLGLEADAAQLLELA
jgi:hypothetical protein